MESAPGRPVDARSPRSSRVRVVAPSVPHAARVLTTGAIEFLGKLAHRFEARRQEILAHRAEFHERIVRGHRPTFPESTSQVREGDWQVAPPPAELADRRVEITGPTDRRMVIHALNSGACVYMADFEDAHSPVWARTIEGHANLMDAVRGTIEDVGPEGDRLTLVDRPAVLFARPRGWHLDERHVEIDGRPISASLFDFGLYLFHNASELVARGHAPYFYLPKIEHFPEAELWDAVFRFGEAQFGLARGTIRATVLIETLPAIFEAEEILYSLREHSAGLNCGRWDYIFSFIKQFRDDASAIFPDRAELTMDRPFLLAYARHLIRTCHRRGAHAIGGMAAQVPIRSDPEANAKAIAAVLADKEREVTLGHDGTWVAHPGLVAIARRAFDARMPGPNQIARRPLPDAVSPHELLEIPNGAVTDGGVRTNVRVAVRYLEAWLRGIGSVSIDHRMEDAATVEIARAQLWQWAHRSARLASGETITIPYIAEAIRREAEIVRAERARETGPVATVRPAARLLEELVTNAAFQEFFTNPAYRLLEPPTPGGTA